MSEPVFQTEVERTLYEALAKLTIAVEYTNVFKGKLAHALLKECEAALTLARGEQP